MLMQDVAGEAEVEAPAALPQVFVRAFSVPAGMPWEQARAAQLEARHGAPLPIADLRLRLKRLASWAPGRAARYGAFYVRLRDYRGPFETTVEVDGQTTKVAFGTGAAQMQRMQRTGLVLALVFSTVAAVVTGLMLAFDARRETAAARDTLAQLSAAKLRSARAHQARQAAADDLQRAVGRSRPVEDVVADLAWVASAKAGDARIVGVHWDHGLIAVEVRGDATPFAATSRPLERSDKPIRPGVWLWGVAPEGAPGEREIGP